MSAEGEHHQQSIAQHIRRGSLFANSTPEHRVDLAVPHARRCGDGNSRVPTLSINAMQARQ
jgi:hypothetical protein